MASETDNLKAFEVQAFYCRAMEAPVTTRIVEALPAALDRSTATGRAVLDWPGEPVADALVLRLMGGCTRFTAPVRTRRCRLCSRGG